MIRAWRTWIPAELPCEDLIPNTEQFMLDMHWNDIRPNRIPKHYQFYEEEILDPILLKKNSQGVYHLHPGNNRYVGASLRPEKTKIDAVIFTDGDDSVPGAELAQKIKGKIDQFNPLTEFQHSRTATLHWSREWRWMRAFGHVRITLLHEHKQVTLLHREQDITEEAVIDIKDHGGMIETLKLLCQGKLTSKREP